MKTIDIFINIILWLALINSFYILLFVEMEIKLYFFITIMIFFLWDMLKGLEAEQDKRIMGVNKNE